MCLQLDPSDSVTSSQLKSEADMTAATKSMEGERSGSWKAIGMGSLRGPMPTAASMDADSSKLSAPLSVCRVRHH